MEAPDHNLPRNLLKREASAFSESSLTIACGGDDDDDLTTSFWRGITYEYLFYRNVAADSTGEERDGRNPFSRGNASASIMNGCPVCKSQGRRKRSPVQNEGLRISTVRENAILSSPCLFRRCSRHGRRKITAREEWKNAVHLSFPFHDQDDGVMDNSGNDFASQQQRDSARRCFRKSLRDLKPTRHA